MRTASRRRQRGAALMAMLAVIVLGGSWWLVSALSTPVVRAPLEADHNAQVLSRARTALLGWVAHRALMAAENHPGRLPCPESPGAQNNHDGTKYLVDDDGVMASSCTLPAVGRFPWRSMGIDKLTDAAGEPLWYVVSPGWAFPFPGADPVINSNNAGQLALDGRTVVALIIAPGKLMNVAASAGCTARQQSRARQPSVAWDPRDFLECENATSPADPAFVSSGPSGSFNDQVIGITAKDVWLHVEGPVAERIRRDVVQQLQTVYAGAEWGTSAANPAFPFAATFADPAASDFKGAVDLREGLLPFTASTCNPPLTNGRCDPNFVQWNIAGITAVRSGGNANTGSAPDCSASTASEIVCSVTYGRFLCSSAIISPCSVTGGTLTVTATVQNLGMALRQQASPLPVTDLSSPSMSSAFVTAGADRGGATVTVTGTLPTSTGCAMSVFVPGLGIYICVGALGHSTTQTVRIPISVFADHVLVNPPTGNAAYWFTANNWHHVTYYGVSEGHTPTAAAPRNCPASGSCLTLNVPAGAPLTDRRALLALAGRSLNGTVGSNRALNDFLDIAENTNADSVFQQNRVTQTFNDRFVTVSP